MNKTLKVLIVLVVVGGAAAGAVALWCGNGTARGNQETAVPTATVTVGPIRLSVESTGRVEANLDVEIKCKASGEIVRLPYDVSDTVAKGDLLVELDPRDEERRVRQKEVTLKAAEAKLAQARLNLEVAEKTLATDRLRAAAAVRSAEAREQEAKAKADRVKALLDKKIATPEEYDTALTAAIQAAADLENARTRIEELKTQEEALELKRQDVTLAQTTVQLDAVDLELARQSLADTKVVAPIDGVVTARTVQTGQIISSAISNVGGGSTIMILSDLSRLFVTASVDESDIGKVARDQPVIVTADAFPDIRFNGRVVRIAPRGVNVSNVVTFEVTVEVLGRNKALLKPEMTANVEIVIAEKQKALLVPVDAVRRVRVDAPAAPIGRQTAASAAAPSVPADAGRDAATAGQDRPGHTATPGGAEVRANLQPRIAHVVTVVKDGGITEEREVQVGITDGVSIEIVSGLVAGETVQVRKAEAESRWRSGGTRGPGLFPGAGPPPGGRR